VDWVALASLRDGANMVLDYDSAGVQVGGITLPGTLAGWFGAARFGQVENKTNLFFDSDLSTLVKASQRFSSGSVVCLGRQLRRLHVGRDELSGNQTPRWAHRRDMHRLLLWLCRCEVKAAWCGGFRARSFCLPWSHWAAMAPVTNGSSLEAIRPSYFAGWR
jgi:hypothetical protein